MNGTADEGHDCNGVEEPDEDLEVLRLTEMVRQQYLRYLEKQLKVNVLAWTGAKNKRMSMDKFAAPPELQEEHIHRCAELLEDQAIKACMVAKLYQRTMVKIIANVRRQTNEQRLEDHLKMLLKEQRELASRTDKKSLRNTECWHKATQTEVITSALHAAPVALALNECTSNHCTSLSLEEKIDMFQERLNREALAAKRKSLPWPDNSGRRQIRKRSYAHMSSRRREKTPDPTSPQLSVSSSATLTPPPPAQQPQPQLEGTVNKKTIGSSLKQQSPLLEEDDNIARELAQLFNEEKTELDEIFGIDPNAAPDDPQISSILREIENAKLPNKPPQTHPPGSPGIPAAQTDNAAAVLAVSPPPSYAKYKAISPKPAFALATNSQSLSREQSGKICNLRRSLWPCELYMQRRRLSASLSLLIEEDFRWHEVIKWKFSTLFGEDSDDEFAACSPSIELDEVLIGSCVQRISPWLVKHLMKPLEDGLIGNRFLFKKLAKKLARSIVMEQQYPDERVIKRAVENFFCLHQAVMSIDDLSDMQNISFSERENFNI